MQSSYRVIKNSSVMDQGAKEIVTEFEDSSEKQKKEWTETNAKNFIDSYEVLAKSMIENARTKSEELLSKAYSEAKQIEEDAYKSSYAKGYDEGKELGYRESYDECYTKNIDRALKEAEDIKKNADNIINSSIYQGQEYLKDKEEQIKQLIINAVESILKREVKDNDGMNSEIFDALSTMRNTKNFVIKTREKYCEEIKSNIDIWKMQLPFTGHIFIVADNMQEEGTVIIEKDSGKTVLSIDIALERVREVLYGTS